MNKNKKLWVGAISVVLAFLLFVVLLMIQRNMLEEPVYKEVICAKVAVSESTLITEQNISQYFERKAMPVDWLPQKYISDAGDVYGKVVEADLSVGTILTAKNIKPYEAFYEAYKNLTWIGVPIEELYAGVAGTLRAGDYIDIYTLYEVEGLPMCSLLAENVRIAAAYSQKGEKIDTDNTEGLSQLIVIPMEKEQVPLFYQNLVRGKIRIAKYEA